MELQIGQKNNLSSIIVAILGFVGATFFHGAMFIGALAFVAFLGIHSLKRFLNLIKNLKVNLKIVSFLVLSVIAFNLYLTNKIYVPYLGNFKSSTNI